MEQVEQSPLSTCLILQASLPAALTPASWWRDVMPAPLKNRRGPIGWISPSDKFKVTTGFRCGRCEKNAQKAHKRLFPFLVFLLRQRDGDSEIIALYWAKTFLFSRQGCLANLPTSKNSFKFVSFCFCFFAQSRLDQLNLARLCRLILHNIYISGYMMKQKRQDIMHMHFFSLFKVCSQFVILDWTMHSYYDNTFSPR